jgi:hypothetical protein
MIKKRVAQQGAKEKSLILLPGPRNMKILLLAVSREPHFKQHLYPRWVDQAREELNPQGVAIMVADGINRYLKLFEGDAKKRMAAMLDALVVQFIGALVNDLELGAQAYEFYDAARQKAMAAANA